MTNVKNETTSNTTAENTTGFTAPQATPSNGASLMKKVKDAISAMNIQEARSRKAVAVMVASFVEMGEAYVNVPAVTSEIDAQCKAHGVDPVNLADPKNKNKNPNIFLPLMSIVDGTWRPVLNSVSGKPVKQKDGTPKMKWARNRSFEKYASVIRFFIHNGISHDKVVEILTGDELIYVEGIEDGVKPLIREIVAADTIQQNGERRKAQIWTDDLKDTVAVFEPVAKVAVTEEMENSISFSDGYAAVIVRVEDGELSVLFDSGLEADALFRLIKKRVAELDTPSGSEDEFKEAA